MRSVLGRVFRYAIHTGRATSNPAGDLHGAIAVPIVTSQAAITRSSDVRAFMRRIESHTDHIVTPIAL